MPAAPRNGDGIAAVTPIPAPARPVHDIVEHLPVHLGVPHDPTAADPGPTGLELRLDEQDQLGVRRRQPGQRRRDQRQRDERQVGDADRAGLAADRGKLEAAEVGPFEEHHPGILSERPVQLPAADVHRDHRRRSPLEQAVREPTGRGTRRRAPAARRRRPRTAPAPRRASRRPATRTAAGPRRARSPRARRPDGHGSGRGSGHGHPAFLDGLRGPGAAAHEAAPHELDIEAAAHSSARDR